MGWQLYQEHLNVNIINTGGIALPYPCIESTSSAPPKYSAYTLEVGNPNPKPANGPSLQRTHTCIYIYIYIYVYTQTHRMPCHAMTSYRNCALVSTTSKAEPDLVKAGGFIGCSTAALCCRKGGRGGQIGHSAIQQCPKNRQKIIPKTV